MKKDYIKKHIQSNEKPYSTLAFKHNNHNVDNNNNESYSITTLFGETL